MLTPQQLEDYRATGYLVLPGLVDRSTCDGLKSRMAALVDAEDLGREAGVFSATNRTQDDDSYFLDSGDKIRFFFEEEAADDVGRSPIDTLNKVGHALHDLDPVFAAFSRSTTLRDLARDLGFVDPLLLQSMYIFKPPHIGGEVGWHTDHPFLWTEPQTVTGFWLAIDDATVDNGCLWCLPGLHTQPPRERYRRSADGSRADLEILDASPFPDDVDPVPLEASAGTVVVLHGQLPHWSAPNRSDRQRHAYTLHLIDGIATYAPDNWLQRGADMPLRGFDTDPGAGSSPVD